MKINEVKALPTRDKKKKKNKRKSHRKPALTHKHTNEIKLG